MGPSKPNLGPRSPSKGFQPSGLADALFTRTQQRVLAILFGQPQMAYPRSEIIKLAEGGIGAVHRELQRLHESGLIVCTSIGNQKTYQANSDSPLFHELHSITQKTVGLLDPLSEALVGLSSNIEAAFVYGSVAKGMDSAQSDVDLMVLSESLDYGLVFKALASAERKIGRKINPHLMSFQEWQRKLKAGNDFVNKVKGAPKLFLQGSEDVLSTA